MDSANKKLDSAEVRWISSISGLIDSQMQCSTSLEGGIHHIVLEAERGYETGSDTIEVQVSDTTWIGRFLGRPVFSPSGDKIVYESMYNTIWIMDSDGNNRKKIWGDPMTMGVGEYEQGHSPVWGPRDDILFYIRNIWQYNGPDDQYYKDFEFRRINLTTMETDIVMGLADSMKQYDISRDGSKLLYINNKIEMHYMDFVGPARLANQTLILTREDAGAQNISDAKYSSDNSSIVFLVRKGSVDLSIWTVKDDGSGLKQLTSTAYDIYPSWSPDGSLILITSYRSMQSTGIREDELYIIDTTGFQQKRLTNYQPGTIRSSSWSAKGEIIYTAGSVTAKISAPKSFPFVLY
jgi:Tol biopolymer transport system component